EGWVDFAVTDVRQGAVFAGSGGPTYEGEAIVERAGTLSFPVDIALYAADGSVTRTRWDGREASARAPYRGRSPLVGAEIDPEHRILLDDRLGNNARRVTPVLFPRRVLERATFAAEAALSVLG